MRPSDDKKMWGLLAQSKALKEALREIEDKTYHGDGRTIYEIRTLAREALDKLP